MQPVSGAVPDPLVPVTPSESDSPAQTPDPLCESSPETILGGELGQSDVDDALLCGHVKERRRSSGAPSHEATSSSDEAAR